MTNPRSYFGLKRILVTRLVLAYGVLTLFCLDGLRRVLTVPASLRWYDKLDVICRIIGTSVVLGWIMFMIVLVVVAVGQPLQFKRAWHWVTVTGIAIYIIVAGLGLLMLGRSAVLLAQTLMVHPRNPEWLYLALAGFTFIATGRAICYVLGR